MKWQTQFEIDGGKRQGPVITIAVFILVLLTTAASWFHHNKSDVQALSDAARERIFAMKKG